MGRTTLDELLSESFENYQILFNHLKFHNHNAHHLGALYFLGASDEKLKEIYKVLCDISDPYEPSPHSITRSNWRNFLGDERFCKAYKDFFEKELMNSGDDWRTKFLDLLLEDKSQPMINSIVSGLLHPLIHIGYAFELDSRIVAIEALTQTALCYNALHDIIDKLEPPKSPSKSAIEIFQDVCSDDQLATADGKIFDNVVLVVKDLNEHVLRHYNQWKINESILEQAIEELFDLTVYIYGATHDSDHIQFRFVLLHLLTGMHGVRLMHSHLRDPKVAEHVILQFFYFAIVIYVVSMKPKINKSLIDDYKVDDAKSNWDYVIDRTLNTKLVEIVHLVKVVHSLRAAEAAYGFKNGLYLKTAVKTLDNVNPDDPWVEASDTPKHLRSLKHQ